MDEQRATTHYLNPWAIAQSEGRAPTLCCGTRWAADDRCRAQRWPFLFSTLGSVSKPTTPTRAPGTKLGRNVSPRRPMWPVPRTVYRSILVRRPNQMASSRSQMAWPDGIHLPSVFRSCFPYFKVKRSEHPQRMAWVRDGRGHLRRVDRPRLPDCQSLYRATPRAVSFISLLAPRPAHCGAVTPGRNEDLSD